MAKLPLFIVFVAFTGLSEGSGVLPDGPLNATVGETFLITPLLTPTDTPLRGAIWFFKENNIITSIPGLNTTSSEYEDRITFFPSTGSLELRNLTDADSGEYSVNIIPAAGGALPGSTTLNIYVPVSNVSVLPKSADVVEFSSVRLSCTSSGSNISFLWLNDTFEVTSSDRVHLTNGGSILTIINVTRYDQQPFRCHVFNPVSDGTSDPVNIMVSFGPENTNLLLSPSEEYFTEGSDVRLSCSTESRPPAQFLWFLNGESLLHTEPELILTNIQMNNAGNYSCQAFNNKTMRSEQSQLAAISVLEKISGASVEPSITLIVERNSVNLTCEASGSIWTRMWKKDGSDLILADNMMLSDNNRSLSFNPVNRNDNGEYFCNISNPVSSNGVKYDLVVNYGPENIQITGLPSIKVKSPLTLTCSAESTPSANYTWKFNGATILNNSAEFVKEMVELSDSGNYTCEARNSITGGSSAAVHGLSVLPVSDEPSSCPAGCIAGIVIACCVLIAVAVGVGFYVHRKKKYPKTSSKRNTSRGHQGQDNTGYSSEEVNYADVRFLKNENDGEVRVGLQNTSSNYAQVRVNKGPPAAPPNYDDHMQRMKRQAPQPGANDVQS